MWRMLCILAASCLLGLSTAAAVETMNVGYLWHMHQPIYYPGETISQTDAAGHFTFNLADIHNQRFGPYTSWPKDAIQAGPSQPHLGAQVSFSGSLIRFFARTCDLCVPNVVKHYICAPKTRAKSL